VKEEGRGEGREGGGKEEKEEKEYRC